MNCLICKSGNMASGKMSITIKRQNATVVVKSVPANICDYCARPSSTGK